MPILSLVTSIFYKQMRVSLKSTVRVRLLLCRELLTGGSVIAHSNPAEETIVAHEAILLALIAICEQLECLPHKARACLPDYLERLNELQAAHIEPRIAEFLLELHKVCVDMANRAILPDAVKWRGTRRATLEHVTQLCNGFNLPFSESAPGDFRMSEFPARNRAQQETQTSTGQRLDDAQSPTEAVSATDVRRYPRYDCSGEVELHSLHTGRPLKGKLLNLSIGGCFAQSDWPLDIGTRVEVRLEVSGHSFRAKGEVRMVDTRGGMGIEFGSMSSGGRQRLRELIAELNEACGLEITEKPERKPSARSNVR